MSTTVTLQGTPIQVGGDIKVGETGKPFSLVNANLQEVTLDSFGGKRKVLNIFPSIDTPTCSRSVRKFNETASNFQNTVVLCISKDLPFAQARFCGAEGISNCVTLSGFRNTTFDQDYGVKFLDGPLFGLYARAVVVLDENDKVIYHELVQEVANEPNYDAVIKVLNN